MKDYGFSWDYHYHYYAGRYHLGLPVPKMNDPAPVPFSSPDPRLTTEDPFGPYTQIVPALSSYIFYEKLNILPYDAAYNLPSVVIGSLGIFLIFVIATDVWNKKAGWISAIFLALLPNYFGYLHINMKDIPNAFFFSLSLYLFYKLTQKQTVRRLIWAAISFAVAFNTKINSIFIPVICVVYFLLSHLQKIGEMRGILGIWEKNKKVILYFVLAPLVAFLLWLPFWKNPISKLAEIPRFYSNNTYRMPVLFFGKVYHSGVNIPFGYPFIYIAITTPPVILIGFLIGLMVLVKSVIKGEKRVESLFLIVWFFLPLIRYFSPTAGAIDGVRHFMEVVYPLSCIAGIGVESAISYLSVLGNLKKLGIIGLILICLFVPIIHYHPYETSYFNFLIGGVRGASLQFDIDFWGTPQKEAMEWLNKNAAPNSKVHIVMAQSSAAVYLRSDMLTYANTLPFGQSDYVVLLNRESFFSLYGINSFKDKKIKDNKVVFKKEIDGIPLVWIFKK